jgi:uncharacterized membrane protein
MDSLELFFGRFHPLLVHLPIGILLLAFVFEVLALRKQFEYLKPAVQPALLIGALSATAACITGYFLSLEGGYAERLVIPHQYLGIATAVFSFALFFLRRASFVIRANQKFLGALLFVPIIITLSLTGHLGGSLTHGEEFLSFAAPEPEQDSVSFKHIVNIDQAVLYSDVIQPILKAKCYSCHSAKKQKGDLRLDAVDFIRHGGENGAIIVNGLPDSSALYKLLLLPLEDERHMPPKGKPQLTSTEIAILQSWIEEGASFERQVKDLAKPDKMKMYVASLQATVHQHWVPEKEVPAPDLAVIAALKAKRIQVLPVARDNHYLSINFVNARTVSDEDLLTLLKLKDQLLWLNLDGTTITDAQLTTIAKLQNLRWLYLNNTKISDKGISLLGTLPELQFLNLVNTSFTDEGLKSLSSLKKLQKLFAYKTNLSPTAIESFHTLLPNAVIDTGGYSLPVLASDSIIFKKKI